MKRGISLKIPNDYGTYLGEILKPIQISVFNWRIGYVEAIKAIDNKIDDLFLANINVIEGEKLKALLEINEYYLIFAELQAFPKEKLSEVETYEDFVRSNCEFVVLVADSCYVTIYCKNKDAIELLYKNAAEYGFENVEYISQENDDTRSRLIVW